MFREKNRIIGIASYAIALLLLVILALVNERTVAWYFYGGLQSAQGNVLNAIRIFDIAIFLVATFFLIKQSRKSIGIALLAYSIFFSLLFVEVFSATTGMLIPYEKYERHRMFSGFYEPDKEFGFKIRANLNQFRLSWMSESVDGTYDTDEFGFRNVGKIYEDTDVFFIGDSFTFGAWVPRESTFVGQLEKKLGQSVISLAVGGYGLIQYRKLAEKYLLKYRPNVVAVGIFANDLQYKGEDTYGDYFKKNGWNAFLKLPSYPETGFFFQVVERLKPYLKPAKKVIKEKLKNGLVLYKSRNRRPNYFSKGDYKKAEEEFAKLLDVIRSRGASPIVFLFPSKESAYAHIYEKLWGNDGLKIEVDGYGRMCDIAMKRNVTCVDLTMYFREHSLSEESELLYFEKDPHWNDKGHSLAATLMLPYITPMIE